MTSAYYRAKGSIFETGILKLFRTIKGVFAERLTRAGSKDEGDMVVIIAGQTYILELKNRKKLDLPQFWREAQVEALNYAKARGIGEVPLHYVVVKRRNAGLEKSWVVQDLEQWLKEKTMPTPQGEITSTETWSEAPAEEVVEETTDESDDTE